MEDFKNNKKVLFIPGWLDTGELHGHKYSLDIWNNKINVSKDFKAEYVIAHSISVLAVLHNWSFFKNYKIILVNPVISKRHIFRRWLMSMMEEGTHISRKRLIVFLSVIPASVKAFILFKVPALKIINTIPRGNLIVIYGEDDKYLCDFDLVHTLAEKGFKTIKVKGSGHNYDAKIEKVIAGLFT